MKQTILIRLFETDFIMQDNTPSKKKNQQPKAKPKNKKKFTTDEQKTKFPAEDLKQDMPQKVQDEKCGRPPLNNKQRRKIRKHEGTFSKKEYATLLDAYEKTLTEAQRIAAEKYAEHELMLYDTDPMNEEKEGELKKFLICEFLSKQRRQIPERYKSMTPEQRQAEIDNDPVAQNKLYHIENYTPPEDETDLMALYRNQFRPVYEKQT